MGAQRLSASSEFSLTLDGLQRCGTSVLNAFRHHRNSHAAGLKAYVSSVQCSTPFGIIGILTRRQNEHPSSSSPVLNAFRHHWNSHIQSKANRLLFWIRRCSTPFGIIGILTPMPIFGSTTVARAQRLSASSEFFTVILLSPFRVRGAVLNAFRHHRNSSPKPANVYYESSRCSTPFGIIGILTRMGWRDSHFFVVLNAFRHHRNSHAANPNIQFLNGIVLNAFRHPRNFHDQPFLTSDFQVPVLNAFRHPRNFHRSSSKI